MGNAQKKFAMSQIVHYQSPSAGLSRVSKVLHRLFLLVTLVIPIQGAKISDAGQGSFSVNQSAIISLDTATTGSCATSTDDQQSPKEKGPCSILRE